ncbi:hypothetical protein RHGRI_004251 [Rhododendron griersonianum]|uniref:Uncharacterized protein n=1 Tax=Rhododendron griersonianum TaxID=479676 RepID=A0AAV6L8S5_9ERIC|nr:hypothetical protein RHGRI_004251 [Rhododendron griersonianum]
MNSTLATSFGKSETKSERRWFVDALNSVQIQPLDDSSPLPADAGTNPDFQFGLDKKHASSVIAHRSVMIGFFFLPGYEFGLLGMSLDKFDWPLKAKRI